MSIKKWLKQYSFINSLNTCLKGYQLKYQLKYLAWYYKNQCKRKKIQYDEQSTIDIFRARHKELCPYFSPKKLGELNIFWVGANRAQDESGFLQALNRIGKVIVFNNNSSCNYGPLFEKDKLNWIQIRDLNDEALFYQLTKAYYEYGVDILIGQMWADIYSAEVLKKIRNIGIPVINIAMDDRLPIHWTTKANYRMGSVGFGSGADLVLTTSAETCAWYAAEGMSAIFWLLASDANLFSSRKTDLKDINILFIGNRYGIRAKIVDEMHKRGLSVTCYGQGWPNGPVKAEKNTELSKRAKIILGIGTVGHCSDIYTLKLRDFDALMTGALYITHRNPDLLKIFVEGVHLECYESLDELYQKLSFYLSHPTKREHIGKQGQQLAKERHSWDYRLLNTFRHLGLLADS